MSNSLKFTGKVEIEKPLDNDKNYTIAIDGSITNVSTSPNGDGTFSNTFSFRPLHCIIHNELGETIKAKDPRRNSEKIRSKLKFDWDKGLWGTDYREFDEAYDAFFRILYGQYDYLISQVQK